jgi:redox-sensing transcriptional repressor
VPSHKIPEATVARLPVYLRALTETAKERTTTISSDLLALRAGVNAAQVRKDLSHLGSYGVRGVGYDVAFLMAQVNRELGLTEDRRVAIVGAGNLGRALLNYNGFAERGFRIVAAFDSDPAKIGQRVASTVIRSVGEMAASVVEDDVAIAVITTPPAVAQDLTDVLVQAGVVSILNFAPTVLSVPEHVTLRQVDLGIELQILSFYEQQVTATAAVRPGATADAG